MKDSGIKIEVHLIQNYAPSNLNRDDAGQPKSATFGGFRRARISSQCTKKNARDLWRKNGAVTVGDRTKKLQELITDALAAKDDHGAFAWKIRGGIGDELLSEGVRVFTDAYYATADKKKPENTSVLVFTSPAEIDVCVQAVKDLWDDAAKGVAKKDSKQANETVEGIASIAVKRMAADKRAKPAEARGASVHVSSDESQAQVDEDSGDPKKDDKRPKLKVVDAVSARIKSAQVSADIALFGRMLAEQPGRNTDGACQVAHPISTHKVNMEMDFYTAVDDMNPKEETGAGMMGTVGFNSACYYRYALVDRDQLARNLARKTERDNGAWTQTLEGADYEEADKVIRAFLEAMVYAIPTGKQNSFAAQNLPSFGMFVRRNGGVPISLANAFCKPVRPTKDDEDIVGLSVAALIRHWNALQEVYGKQGVQATSCFHVEQKGRLESLAGCAKVGVQEAIRVVMEEVREAAK